MPRRVCQVPGAAVRVDIGLSGLSQRSVHAASLGGGCRFVESRADQRMAKKAAERHFQQAICLNWGSCGLVDPEIPGGAPEKTSIARWLGSREQEQVPGG